MPIQVLLVEDDADVAAGIGDYLEAQGVRVEYAAGAAEAKARALASVFDVFVLDVNLPGRDGIALCRELKQSLGLAQPAIFLTARGALDDKLRGFDAGAVDWMVKPFAPAELLARIRAVHAHAAQAPGARVQVGDYALDVHGGVLRKGDAHLALRAAALAILRRLMQAHPATVARAALCDGLWDGDAPDSDPLRTHVWQLRQALAATFGTAPVVTVRGIGYRFEPDQ
jgi:DNA-binding response OmpR family regulator